MRVQARFIPEDASVTINKYTDITSWKMPKASLPTRADIYTLKAIPMDFNISELITKKMVFHINNCILFKQNHLN